MDEPMTLDERLLLLKSILKTEEKKLRRYSKIINSYTKKHNEQIKWCNRYVGDIAIMEDRIRQQNKK